jgi:hypothetical protein
VVTRQWIAVAALAILLRLPFLHQPVQGDDVYFLYGAERALIDPLHPLHTRYAFLGEMVDMRGHTHPPLDSWFLGALLSLSGQVNEAAFHAVYALFGVIAALAMLSLARRFCPRPVWATLLFMAVPAFVVNGNSLEADLPFLAFWMLALAWFVRAVDTGSGTLLTGSAAAAALAGLAAYQAILLTPILAVYLYRECRQWKAAWAAALAAPAAIAGFQIFERATGGAMPASVLAGYLPTFQTLAAKLRSAVTLVGHAGWIVSPVIVLGAFAARKRQWAAAVGAALAAALYDPNPLFWASIGCGVLLLAGVDRDFPGAWIWIYFAGALAIFFAGSARYLLPMAAPVAILAAKKASPRLLAAGFALQAALALGLAAVNYSHWSQVRDFARSAMREAAGRRVWVNGEWGLRFYAEQAGALPLLREHPPRAGDVVLTSEAGQSVRLRDPVVLLQQAVIAPAIPLRIVSLEGGSGYSTSGSGLLPFEISGEPIDRLRAEAIAERQPSLSYWTPSAPRAREHVVAGLYEDGWAAAEATIVLKSPAGAGKLKVAFYADAPGRRVELAADGEALAAQSFASAGAHTLEAPFTPARPMVTVTVRVDPTHRAPPDQRDLGVVITGIGFVE